MHVKRLHAVLVASTLLTVAACGSGESAGLTVMASSAGTIGLGSQRVLVTLLSNDQDELASPDLPVVIEFARASPREVVGEVAGDFVWLIPDVRGVYVTTFVFDRPGEWEATVIAEGRRAAPFPFVVVDDPILPDVGDPAPPSITRTSADFDLDQISTDPNPDPEFYRLSLDEALGSGRPTVVVFATPAFCQTQTCGPMLDLAKEAKPGHPDHNYVHVEIYEDLNGEVDELVPVAAVTEWRLPSEPWLFVVDADGVVMARFEGVVSPEELEEALTHG
jgi:hypothetical protein